MQKKNKNPSIKPSPLIKPMSLISGGGDYNREFTVGVPSKIIQGSDSDNIWLE